MKKSILISIAALISVAVSPKDTTIQILFNINQYRALLATMDRYIDSKSVTKDWFDFLQKSAMIYQSAEKPKEQPKPKQ